MGPLATVVNGDTSPKEILVATERISIARTMVASARVVSSLAKCSPMHGQSLPRELGGIASGRGPWKFPG